MLPPRWLRRLLIAPLAVVVVVGALTSLPLVVIAAAGISPWLPGRLRPLRLLWFTLVYLTLEVVGLVAAFAIWVASGFGVGIRSPRWQDANYRLLGWVLSRLVGTARRAFDLSFDLGSTENLLAEDPDPHGPLLVLARHAGPGDSLLLVHAVTRLRRRPRIVAKATLQWEPLLDVLLNRVATQWIGSGATAPAAADGIAALAASMRAGDVLVIFPEGGNFTEGRRLRSITKLEELGRHRRADRARAMRHVLAPRPTGVLRAIDAAPHADVVFVAHTGLEDLSSIVDVWRGLPMDAAVRVAAWWESRTDIPEAPSARIDWLDGWWLRIDRWIVDQVGHGPVPDTVVRRTSEGA